MPDVSAIWERIERWYANHVPQRLAQLGPPASDEDLAALQVATGLSLPDDVRASLSRHNGNSFIYGFDYLNTGWAAEVWQRLTTRLEQGQFQGLIPGDTSGRRFAPVWWSRKWLPVAEHRAGTIMCVDTAPGPQGVIGQVLELDLSDEGPALTGWRSFAEWLDAYRGDLEAGKYQVDQYGNLNRIAE
jgi:cell wall assembly regulator SMI1